MTTAAKLSDSRSAHYFFSFLMAVTLSYFAYNHIHAFLQWGESSYLLFCLAESVMAFMFIVRTQHASVSGSPLDWLLGFAGTFAPLLFDPGTNGLIPNASWLLIIGSVMMFAGVLSLNRSFGVVAARRTIKTSGAYAVVRHPLYSSYLVMFTGYVLSNTSWRNVLVCVLAIGLMFGRIFREEHHLAKDSDYRVYMEKVKYRLIPYLF